MSRIGISALPAVIMVAVGVIFWMAGDGSYRYPCQDPENFDKPECNVPACLADESCTSMLINTGE